MMVIRVGSGAHATGGDRAEPRRAGRGIVATRQARRRGTAVARGVAAFLATAALATAAIVLAAVAPAVAADLRIGVALPLSGPDALYGDEIRQGAELAVADANANGGFGPGGGLRGRIIARDDGNDPAKAAAVAKGFVADGVPVVIGGLSSAATVAASAVYAEGGVVEIAPVAAAPAVTDRGLKSVFRLGGRDDAEPADAVRLLLAHHVGRVAIAHDRTNNGKAFADAVRAGLTKAGVVDVFYGSLEKGGRDPAALAALAGRIRASAAQVVVFGGGGSEAGQLIRQLRDAGSRATMLGGSALASDDFAAAGGTAADGAMLVFPQDPRTRPAAAELLRRLRAKGAEPDAYVFYGYAAVQVIQQAVAAAGSAEPARIAAAMHAGRPFQTVLGPVAFDGKGDRTGDMAGGDDAVYVWHRGAAGRMAFDEQARF